MLEEALELIKIHCDKLCSVDILQQCESETVNVAWCATPYHKRQFTCHFFQFELPIIFIPSVKNYTEVGIRAVFMGYIICWMDHTQVISKLCFYEHFVCYFAVLTEFDTHLMIWRPRTLEMTYPLDLQCYSKYQSHSMPFINSTHTSS